MQVFRVTVRVAEFETLPFAKAGSECIRKNQEETLKEATILIVWTGGLIKRQRREGVMRYLLKEAFTLLWESPCCIDTILMLHYI